MKYLNHLEVFPLLLGFLGGLFAIYIIRPNTVSVTKYPNLENANTTTYSDLNGTCFQYETKKVDCDKNEDKIKPYPLQ